MQLLLATDAAPNSLSVKISLATNQQLQLEARNEMNPRGGTYRKIHPPRPKRFPKGGDCAPRGPRAKPEGNLEGRGVQNPRTREISRAEGGVFSDTSRLEAVYGHSFIIIRELLILLLDNRWR